MRPVRTLRRTFSHVSALALTFETSSVFRAMGTVPAFFSASLWHVRQYRWSSARSVSGVAVCGVDVC